jgi:hypothetical protein
VLLSVSPPFSPRIVMAFQTQGTSGRWSDTSQRPNPNIAAGEVRSNNMGHPYRRALPAKVGEKRGRHRQENSALGGGDTVEGPPDNTDESPMPEQKKARIEKAGESSSGDNEGVEGESRAGDDAAARKPPTDMEQRKVVLHTSAASRYSVSLSPSHPSSTLPLSFLFNRSSPIEVGCVFCPSPIPCYPPDPVGTNLRQGSEDPEPGDDNDGQVRPILLLLPLLFQTQYSAGEDMLLFNAHHYLYNAHH